MGRPKGSKNKTGNTNSRGIYDPYEIKSISEDRLKNMIEPLDFETCDVKDLLHQSEINDMVYLHMISIFIYLLENKDIGQLTKHIISMELDKLYMEVKLCQEKQ